MNDEFPKRKEPLKEMEGVQAEMSSILAEHWVQNVLSKIIPCAADQIYELGNEELL